ncbi:hypothetical protein [Metabacillus sp. FJAT-53654]|uniref:Uncharacterized protein n=1 Tax=Metabacillus rhizosphaerae TaxID=3117747 RepID=A0ABZ2MUI8_9BACI
MSDWNEQAAPNNNLPAKSIRSSKMLLSRQNTFKSRSLKSSTEDKR